MYSIENLYIPPVTLISPIDPCIPQVNICSKYCIEWDICLNSKKTKNMVFGKASKVNFSITLDGMAIEWVNEWKYLGVILRSGSRYGCSVVEKVKSFYKSLNTILRVEGRSDDMVMLRISLLHCCILTLL